MRLWLILLPLCLVPLTAVAGEPNGCLTLRVKTTEHTCANPNPLLRPFVEAPVFFTVAEDRCDRDVKLIMSIQKRENRVVGGSFTIIKAKRKENLVGCGEPAQPIGWCFVDESEGENCKKSAFHSLK